MEIYRGYELNKAGDPAPWSYREEGLHKSVINTLLDHLHTTVYAPIIHSHSELKRPSGTNNPSVFVNESGSVGIGTLTPMYQLDVDGLAIHLPRPLRGHRC